MSTRTYLSIGDVLTLLREEFPDVTISKIRFLESQGLVNPERSPSGYRKFYESDVERLRWVLRQQREHFLPLKVIRDRLADGVVDDEPIAATSAANGVTSRGSLAGVTPLRAEAAPAARVAEPVTTSSHPSALAGESPVPPDRPAAPDNGVGGPAPAPRVPERTPAIFARLGADQPTRGPAVSSAPSPRPVPERPSASVPTTGEPARPERPLRPERPAVNPIATDAPAPSPAPAPAPAPRVPPRADAPTSPPPRSAGAVTGASLTVDELCSASGLSPAEVASLEGFGLLEAMVVGGAIYYDEEALIVAKLAQEFGRYGIEARHLRLYRNAVDRELGLIEQITTPLLRQRNPEARQRAVDAAGDVTRLGQNLRASLLRRDLHRQLGS